MNKKIVVLILISTILLLALGGTFYFYKIMYPIEIQNISYELKGKNIKAYITFKNKMKNGICIMQNESYIPIENKECILDIPNEQTNIIIKTNWNEIPLKLNPDMNEIIDFTLKEEQIYLISGEEKKIELSLEFLGNPNKEQIFQSENEEIVKVKENTLIGVGPGKTKVNVTLGKITKSIDVTVTNLLTLPIYKKRKDYLKCGIYTKEDNIVLDEFLEYRINNAGYGTRAGVVEALRFLTLMFPYQINYFYESGRLNNNTGGNYVDGEGRFYHKGLYLHQDKYQEISPKKYGPAIWGCPLTNWQDEAGFIPGVKYPNGLDCSGFITWAMYNGGFDPKDTGAGDNPWTDDDLSDLGPHELITMKLLQSNTLKAGDIIATDGHIAMIGGIKDGIVYVAESTTYWHGVVMHPYTYQELIRTDYLTYVIKMDHYYKEDGNYKEYWE